MRVVACLLLASAAMIFGAPASLAADCPGDCGSPRYVPAYVEPADCTASYDVAPHKRMYYKSHARPHRSHGCRAYRGHGYRPYPAIVYGDSWSQMGPVYLSTGQYHYGPYVSHRAVFGYGGCRTAVLPYGPNWHVASNC
jgi:hypothetical protein